MEGDRVHDWLQARPSWDSSLCYVHSYFPLRQALPPLADRIQPSTKTPVSLWSPQVAVLTTCWLYGVRWEVGERR